MEFAEVLRRRHMVRDFDDRPLASDVVERVVAAALRGPSAGFTQGTELLVIEGPTDVARFWDSDADADRDADMVAGRRRPMPWPGLRHAPLVIVPFAHEAAYRARYSEPDKVAVRPAPSWRVPWWLVDASFAALLSTLAATDEGLGALFFGLHRPDAVKAAFGVPDSFDPIGAIAVGYPRADRRSSSLARGRRPPAELIHRGRW